MSKKAERRAMRASRKAQTRVREGNARAAVLRTDEALVDIVMPIFGEWALAEEAISRIPAALGNIHPNDYRLIVCDNGTPVWTSNDGTETLAPDAQAKGVKDLLRKSDLFFRLENNIGYPGAVDEMVARGRSPLILILTADVMLDPKAIEVMVRECDQPNVGVVGLKLLFPSDVPSPHGPPGKVQHAGIAFDIRGKPKHVFIAWSPGNPRVNQRREMAAVTGACLMTRRNLWDQVGGFDRRYGAGTYEDIDYCFAVRMAGRKVIYTPEASGTHLVSGAKLQGANAGFNVGVNETIFRGKYAQVLAWDEWRYF